ncbi:MAG: ABC transporter permease [Polyangiaceae bacterium]|nr:ABC transporter permease [Polyangiaceae bacterium]
MRELLVQLRVIRALVLRETRTRFGQYRLGYVWALIEPLLWIATFGGMYLLLDRPAPNGLPLVAFLATGIVPFLLFRETSGRVVPAIDANKGLLFYPLVRPLDLVAARVLLEFATHMVVLGILLSTLAVLQGGVRIDNVLVLLTGLLLASGLGAGMGLVFCGLSVFTSSAERVHGPLLRPLFWTSAIFFSSDTLPEPARSALLYNPVLHAVELVRDGWFAGYHPRDISMAYPAVWVLVLLFLGLTLERVARRRIQLT